MTGLPLKQNSEAAEKPIPLNPPTKPEQPPAEPLPAAAEKPQEDLSSRFAALSRKEKAILEREKAIKERETKYGPIAEALESKNTLKLLEAGAISLDDVIQAALKQGEPVSPEDRVKTVEEKLKELQEERERERQEREESLRQDRYREEVSAFTKTLTETLEANSEQYEFIHALGAQDQVFSAIHQVVSADPEAYPTRAEVEALIPQMAEMIENELADKAKKFGQAKKFKSLFSEALIAAGDNAASSQSSPAKVISQPEQTLTNRHAAPPAQSDRPKKLSRDESLARAAEILRQRLNQNA